MPFNVNNVDITVAANFIYAVTMVAVTNVAQNPSSLIDADIEVCMFRCLKPLNAPQMFVIEVLKHIRSR